jgi:hypothetical protein
MKTVYIYIYHPLWGGDEERRRRFLRYICARH